MTPIDATIDPGKAGLAWTVGVGHIREAGLVEGVTPEQFSLAWDNEFLPFRRAVAAARMEARGSRQLRVWVEFMQARGGESLAKTLSKAKALLDLQFVGSALAAAVATELAGAVYPIPYRTWAGGLAEEVVQGRVLRELTSEEVCALDEKRYRKDLRHNLRDAAGIFLYATGRLRPGMVRAQ